MDETDTSAAHSTDAAAERASLELEELRLRVRDLRMPWWRRPSVTAPIATITVSILGLAWGIASGFFDVSKRELVVTKREIELEIRELQESRDQQSQQFRAASIKQQAELNKLREREAQLRKEIDQLDQPALTRADYRTAQAKFLVGNVEVRLRGVNLGNDAGGGVLSATAYCGRPSQSVALPAIPVKITSWSPKEVWLIADVSNARQLPALGALFPAQRCEFDAYVILQRADGRQTNSVDVPLPAQAFRLR